MKKKDPQKSDTSIQSKTAKGMFWSGLEMLGRQGATFIIQIVLARLLLPEDFGLIGMLTIFIALSNVVIDVGFQTWLLHEKAPTEEEFSTVFFFNLFVSIIVYGLLFTGAPFVARFYGQPILSSMLRLLGVSLILNALALVQRTQLTIKLNFKVQTLITAYSICISGAVAIFCAYLGFGVWSLVFQQVINTMLNSLMTIFSNRWLPKWTFQLQSFKKMFHYSWKLVASTMLDTAFNNLNSILIGRYFSPASLGYFSNAQKMQDVIPRSLSSAVQKVSFPVLSRYKDDKQVLSNAFTRILTMVCFVAVPVSFGLSGTGTEIFLLMFGEKWLTAVPYFRIMALTASCYPIHILNLNLLQIVGRTDRFLFLEIIKKVIGITATLIVLFVFRSVMSLVILDFFLNFVTLYVNGYFTGDIIGYTLFDQLKDLSRSFVAGIVMLVAVTILGYFLHTNPLVSLLIKMILGISVYLGASFLINRKEMINFFKTAAKMAGKS
ncbi:lipopolysaccharide biosynthesis protein [Enterococcus sp. AZ109]|uniref:lipopolysaccharide biosynthesis protein n=1 Tax=Enterococcus sp. AZ109 TaxID=2774634 RepID=UPI003F235DC1